MNGLRASTVAALLVTIVATACPRCSAQVPGQQVGARPHTPADWLRATVRGCPAADWSQCVAQKVTRTLRLLEHADHVQIADGIRLVKTSNATDRSAKNHTYDVMDRIVSFVDSHSLQIDLWTQNKNVTSGDEGRRRHHYRKVFPIIVSTYMIMSAILIPMGFMFMSTLGGKALLVSKMALMISLMSNIKKMFSYEYYVPPSPPVSHHWKRTLLAHRTTAGPLYSSYTAR